MVVGWTLAFLLALPPQSDPEIEPLIDRLAARSGSKPIDTANWALVNDFLPVKPTAGTRHFSTGDPSIDAVEGKLESLGLRALPGLLEHLSDSRKTVFLVGGPSHRVPLYFDSRYDPRFPDPARLPPSASTNQVPKRFPGQEYTLRVGDLCFGVIGQIVNRNLAVVGFAGAMDTPIHPILIDSPVQTPALAAAARSDWTGLTSSEHEQDLMRSALDPYRQYAQGKALEKLCFYYPDAGEQVALNLLNRPIFDIRGLGSFMLERLDKPFGSAGAHEFYQEALDRFGPDTRIAFPYLVDIEAWGNVENGDQLKAHADQVLRTALPDYRPQSLPFLPIADLEDQAEIAGALRAVSSTRITKALVSIFDRAEKTVPHDETIPTLWLNQYLDGIAIACFDHLDPQGREKFRAYFKRRISEMKKRDGQIPDGSFRDEMRARA